MRHALEIIGSGSASRHRGPETGPVSAAVTLPANMGLTEFLYTAATAVVVVLGLLGLKVAVTFDYNKYRESRRKEQKEQLRMLCTHAVGYENGQFRSLFVKPPMRLAWRCERCGQVVADETNVRESLNRWEQDPKEWLQLEKKFQKRARKLYRL